MNELGLKLKFENADIYLNKIYFVDFDLTLLFSMDVDSGRISVVSKIPELPLLFQRAFGSLVISNGIVYLSPMRADKIWTYNIENDEWTGLSLALVSCKGLKFRSSIATEGYVYMAGYDTKALLCINIANHEIRNLDSNEKFGFNIVELDNYIYLPCRDKNVVVRVEKETNSLSEIEVPYTSGFCAIEYYHGNLYVAPEHAGNMLRLVKKNQNGKEHFDFQHIGRATTYISGLATNGEILFMGTRHTDGSVVVNGNETEWHSGPSMYCFCKTMNDNSILLSDLEGNVIRIEKDGNRKEYYPVLTKKEFEHECERFNINPLLSNENGMVQECSWFDLEFFLKQL